MARASTVLVVVPSPATSFVLDATCLMRAAPRLSCLFLNSMAFATVTPSSQAAQPMRRGRALVTFGAPKLCSITTLRPLGPRVTATASAKRSAPDEALGDQGAKAFQHGSAGAGAMPDLLGEVAHPQPRAPRAVRKGSKSRGPRRLQLRQHP